MKNIFLLLVIVTLFSCKNEVKKEETPKEKVDLAFNELFALMQGSFNSAKQAEADSTYYDISLHMYPIWEGKGHYLYVEQALNKMQNKPYRQRIYQLERVNDSLISSTIYKIPNDSLWIGKWKDIKSFDSISPSNLVLREGCEVVMKKIDEQYFKGKTGDTTCKSTLRGAAYARSEVEVFKDKIISWDRGFDQDGNYVWGAEKAGYVFDKLVKEE